MIVLSCLETLTALKNNKNKRATTTELRNRPSSFQPLIVQKVSFVYFQNHQRMDICYIDSLPTINMRLLYLATLLAVFQSCNPGNSVEKEVALRYFYINYEIALLSEVMMTEDTLDYVSSVSSDSIYTLEYVYPKSTDGYILRADSDFEPIYISNAKDTSSSFVYVANQDFKINDRNYQVFKYASNPGSIDGCVTHFWTPEMGIILIRSSTWRNFSKLQTNNDSINKEINLLAELIYQDVAFYYGCTEEMELIPQADMEEYYQKKYNTKSVDSEINEFIKMADNKIIVPLNTN